MRHAQWHFARAVSAENPLEPPGSLHICKVDPREGPVHMVHRLHSAPLVWIEVLKLLSRGEWRRQRERSSYLSRGEARLRGRGKIWIENHVRRDFSRRPLAHLRGQQPREAGGKTPTKDRDLQVLLLPARRPQDCCPSLRYYPVVGVLFTRQPGTVQAGARA